MEFPEGISFPPQKGAWSSQKSQEAHYLFEKCRKLSDNFVGWAALQNSSVLPNLFGKLEEIKNFVMPKKVHFKKVRYLPDNDGLLWARDEAEPELGVSCKIDRPRFGNVVGIDRNPFPRILVGSGFIEVTARMAFANQLFK